MELGEIVVVELPVAKDPDARVEPETVTVAVLLVDMDRDALPVAVPVRDRLTLPVEHVEPVLLFVCDVEPEAVTVAVELFEAVVVDEPLTVDVVERVGDNESVSYAETVDLSDAVTEMQPEALGLALPEPENDTVPLSLKLWVAALELVILGVLEALPE